jgi:mannosyl-oligosaccharide alpha-1,2-mannosidase
MALLTRRFLVLLLFVFLSIATYRQFLYQRLLSPVGPSSTLIRGPLKWKDVQLRYPVVSMTPLPTGAPKAIPRIQHEFGVETEHQKEQRVERLAAVKEAFLHSWGGYKKHAWLQDEVTPVSGQYKNGFGQRGATLVDTLDTLLIMGLDEEFELALKGLKKIDFTTSVDTVLNVFETTIRYLGGLLSAYDLSPTKHHILLEKAVELGDMLYVAFDTPNRMPITRWDWVNGYLNEKQEAPSQVLSAELGSLSLEFTRLSQLSGDPKYFDAIQRITNKFEKHQNGTAIPGLFPILINAFDENFGVYRTFTFGGMSDSFYEYLPKQYLLLGGLSNQYKKLYENAINAAKKHLFFRPLIPQGQHVLVSGTVSKNSADYTKLDPRGEHLACFAGGMVAIGAKIFNRSEEIDVAKKLVDGCIWAYDSMPTGIMPEAFTMLPCKDDDDCVWDEERWNQAVLKDGSVGRTLDAKMIIREDRLQPGFTAISDKRYILRYVQNDHFAIFLLTRQPLDLKLSNPSLSSTV